MKKIFILTLTMATLLLTQVQAEVMNNSSFIYEKTFNSSIDHNQIKKSIIDAVLDAAWKVEYDKGESMTFIKDFTRKSKYYNHAAYRGKKEILHEQVRLVVKVKKNNLSMQMDTKDKHDEIAKKAQKSLKDIHDKMNLNLMRVVL